MKKNKQLQFQAEYILSAEDIDRASEDLFSLLNESGIQRKNALRFRLALEETMLGWQQHLGSDASCRIRLSRHMGQARLQLEVPGVQHNPLESEALDGDSTQKQIFTGLGLTPIYHYSNGVNRISLHLPRKGMSTPMSILLAILLAGIVGFGCKTLPESASAFLDGGLLQPLMNAFMRALSAIAGPLILLSVITGICNIGSKATLGKLGGRLVRDSLLVTLLLTLLPILVSRPSISGMSGNSGSLTGTFTSILNMVLDVIPSNIIDPFSSGNSLQIIVIAVFLGLALLSINTRNSQVRQFCEELDLAVQFIMGLISKLLPAFIFTSILQIILSGAFSSALDAYMLLIQVIICSVVLLLGYIVVICVKFRISPAKLIKKLLPTFIIGITTASSAAAFSTNMETCEKQLGISRKLTSFGIPLGQVIYMPGVMIIFLISALFTADKFGVAITPAWLIIAMVLCTALAVAAPPIPGGAMTCYTIIFTQLGLPMEYLPIILSLNLVLEFIATPVNLCSLQNQMILIANKSENLNLEILKK